MVPALLSFRQDPTENSRMLESDDLMGSHQTSDDDDAYSRASWTGGTLLSIFSIHPLEDRHRISL